MGLTGEVRATVREWRGVLRERIHPAVLLGAGVAAVVLVFGGLVLAILASETGLDGLGLRPADTAAASGGDESTDRGSGETATEGDDRAGGPSAAGESPGGSTPGERGERDGAGSIGDPTTTGEDGPAGEGAGTDGRSATSAPVEASDPTTAPPPDEVATTVTTRPTTTAPTTTTVPPREDTGTGLLGGLLDALGVGAALRPG